MQQLVLELLPLSAIVATWLVFIALQLWRRSQRGYTIGLRPDSETAVAIGRTVLQPGERVRLRIAEHPDPTPPSDPVSTAVAASLASELFDSEPITPIAPLIPETFDTPVTPTDPVADPFADFPTEPTPRSSDGNDDDD